MCVFEIKKILTEIKLKLVYININNMIINKNLQPLYDLSIDMVDQATKEPVKPFCFIRKCIRFI